MRLFREQAGELIGCIIALLLQLLDLGGEGRLAAPQGFDLAMQLGILVRGIYSGSSDAGERRDNDAFLECRHGNGFGCGNES